MASDRTQFLTAMFARCHDLNACLSLTAIHPDGKHPTPSRHIPQHDATGLQAALTRLDAANAQGWGAYFAVGLRRPGLTRWQRGGAADVVALPALFVDVDDPSPEALRRLEQFNPVPSCIVASGGGFHAYWWLEQPTANLTLAKRCLDSLAQRTGGDRLSVAQSMRLVDSRNTKLGRDGASCRLVRVNDQRYPLEAFVPAEEPIRPPVGRTSRLSQNIRPTRAVIEQVSAALMHSGGKRRVDWINARCPFPDHHKHADRQPSFGFNTRTGYGFCHVCGTLLLKDLCSALGVNTATWLSIKGV